LASSLRPFVLAEVCGAAAGAEVRSLPAARSLELNKLWKKLCRTSCCGCGPLGGLVVAPGFEEGGGRLLGATFCCTLSPASPVGLPEGRFGCFRCSGTGLVVFEGEFVELSISLRTRSTLGMLKLLLPRGPTIPAGAPVVRSVGFRNEARGSRSAFFEFSS